MYTLIIVDDDELIRKGLEKVIQWEKMGFSVSGTFKGAMDALEYLKNHTADVILTDIRMPQMNGLQATRQIRALHRADAQSIPIIAMTANAFQEDIQAALEAGMTGFVPKPIDVDQLYRELHLAVMQNQQKKPRS